MSSISDSAVACLSVLLGDRVPALPTPKPPQKRSFSLRYTHTHTHTHLMALFLGLSGCAGTRKVKPVIWILLKQERVSGSGISLAVCKSAPCSRQITTPAPHHSVFTGRKPFLPPNQQRQSTEGICQKKKTVIQLPTPPENVTALTCKLQNIFI